MHHPSIAAIGFGAMARSLQKSLEQHGDVTLSACLVPEAFRASVPDTITAYTSVEDLIAAKPDLVVECATHDAVRESVPPILRAGIDVIIVSIGALADRDLRETLQDAAHSGGSRVSVVSGAIGGLDVLRAGALAGLEEVTYVGRKPPRAWAGTPAETLLNLSALTEPTEFYEGSATQAAHDYPKNTNVTAAVALAGVGFDDTRVKLIADPTAQTNSHELEARGAFGRFRIVLENNALPENPKTSWLAALSVEQAVLRHFNSMEV
ncbi:aspartate dehydrogenase [Yangia mangrovi]|uniref:L-aspartate dehydrogenase n=1 Tax=Alloyangia mangrovi TaxID=1779329 RepID=A0A2A3JY19_9RHOB|nr:aspartate dehydrogenase [Alloyangia mangrovi]MCT4371618.1 aspartate dehydrogenase [Alloyangia mangrovi]